MVAIGCMYERIHGDIHDTESAISRIVEQKEEGLPLRLALFLQLTVHDYS